MTPARSGDAPESASASAAAGAVVVSWNVHGWVGLDRRRDPARSFSVLRALDADVVALQEVEGEDWEPLAARAGFHVEVQRTGDTPFGNAILSRRPPAGVARIDLSTRGRERRGALDALVATPAGLLRVVTTHFGLRGYERRRQAERLARHLAAREAAPRTLLLGDLNDWTPWARQLAPLARVVGRFSRAATFPSRRPVLALDRAALRAPDLRQRVRAVRELAARVASDHLPLRVELVRDAPGASLPSFGPGARAGR